MDASQLAPPPLAAALDQAAQAIAGLVNHAHPDTSPLLVSSCLSKIGHYEAVWRVFSQKHTFSAI
jgi:hypothetical protein